MRRIKVLSCLHYNYLPNRKDWIPLQNESKDIVPTPSGSMASTKLSICCDNNKELTQYNHNIHREENRNHEPHLLHKNQICNQKIVHSSHIQFSTLVTHKNYLKYQIDVKLSGIVEPLFLYHSWKFQICIPFHVVFVDLQMHKIGCVNYAQFPNSGHIIYFMHVCLYINVQEFCQRHLLGLS